MSRDLGTARTPPAKLSPEAIARGNAMLDAAGRDVGKHVEAAQATLRQPPPSPGATDMNAVVKSNPARPDSGGHGGSLVPNNIGEAMQLAQMMASSKMVPKHMQEDVGTCYMVIEQAQRWNMSPFAVAQCTSNISGKLCFEGKLIAASLSSTGSIVGELDYEFGGSPLKPETLSVVASATRSSDGQRKTITLHWVDAKTENKYWRLQPEQQLSYAAARVWARRWTPGPLLGVYAPEEMSEQPHREPPHAGPTIEASAEAPPADPGYRLPTGPQPPAMLAPAPAAPAPRMTQGAWLDVLQLELDGAEDAAALEAVKEQYNVKRALEKMTNGALVRLKAMMKTAGENVESHWLDGLQADLNSAPDEDAVHAITVRRDVMAALVKFTNGGKVRLNAMVKTALDGALEGTIDRQIAASDFPGDAP
jgi:hypothetical protein